MRLILQVQLGRTGSNATAGFCHAYSRLFDCFRLVRRCWRLRLILSNAASRESHLVAGRDDIPGQMQALARRWARNHGPKTFMVPYFGNKRSRIFLVALGSGNAVQLDAERLGIGVRDGSKRVEGRHG